MEKIELEYPIRSSTSVLYDMFSTPSGLSEWFADDVNIKDDVYTFFWDGSEEEARLITKKNNEFIKFHWLEHDEEQGTCKMTMTTTTTVNKSDQKGTNMRTIKKKPSVYGKASWLV